MYSQRFMDRLFINLKVLSKTEEGQKLYTKDEYLTLDDGTSYKQTIMRWIYGEDRVRTLDKIQEVVRNAIGCGQNAINSELILRAHNEKDITVHELREWEAERDKFAQMDNYNLLKSLSSEMKGALNGIRKLQSTYNDDKTLSSKLELEIELLERNIIKFSNFFSKKSQTKELI